MNKNHTISVRLTQVEVDQLGDLTRGQLTRSQIIQILIRDFLGKTREDQQQFLMDKLFGVSRVR
jgi:metal-responsive CopG/Arc/MetJ family transcriptional regulator